MVDLPPPPQCPCTCCPHAYVQIVSLEGLLRPYAAYDEKELVLPYARSVAQALADGFQWEDLPLIVLQAKKFVEQFEKLGVKERKAAVVSILNYVIEHTDTPKLPDAITDPFFKALVPPFVELVFFASELGGEGVRAMAAELKEGGVEGLYSAMKERVTADFSWEKVFDAFSLALRYFRESVDKEQAKTGLNAALSFLIDVTVWPYGIDPIMDPLMKALLPPVINLVVDAI